MVNQTNKLDSVLAEARRDNAKREKGYRERALKMYPHICGRCSREFSVKSLSELTVHHRNHDHDFNPPDGSNWELLCIYCHDNEHQRQHEANLGNTSHQDGQVEAATFNPFADRKSLLDKK